MQRLMVHVLGWLAVGLVAVGTSPSPCSAESDLSTRQTRPASHHTIPAKRLPTYASTSALVQDLRVSQEDESFRLVFDLDRKIRVTQSREKHSGRLIIDLLNTKLTKAAAEKLVQATMLPQAVRITLQQQPSLLRLSLNGKAVSRFNYFFLGTPNRFVLDFTPIQATSPVSRDSSPSPSSDNAQTPSPGPPSAAVPDTAGSPSVSPAPRRTANQIRTIVIDPGHGGKDAGTVSRRGLEEKAITLKVSLRLRDLIKSRLGKRVLMTRDRDDFLELGERAKFANVNEADLFISVHVNSHPQPSVKGIEIYHFGEAKDQRALEVAARENGTPINGNGVGWEYLVADLLTAKRIEESLELAWETKEAMVKHLNGQYQTVDHGVKTAPFYVLRYTAMPSILAEIAFMSNASEEQLMRQSSFIDDVAEALFQGVKSYIDPALPTSR
jgi:N-acetylmuramoyl-L-alanine amidase